MHLTHPFRSFCYYLTKFGQFCEKFRSELVVLLGKHFSDVRFNIVLVNKFTVGSFFNYKDKLPMRLKSSLVYKFSCAQCASEYVCMTARTLDIRVDEHVGVSYRTGARLTQPPHSAIRDHRDSSGTPFDRSKFKYISKCLLYF